MDAVSLNRGNVISKQRSALCRLAKALQSNQGFHKLEFEQLRVAIINELNNDKDQGQEFVNVCVAALEAHIIKQDISLKAEFKNL